MSIIKNIDSLATTQSRRHVLEIIETGIESVLPENLLVRSVKFAPDSKILTAKNDVYDISSGRIFVIGGGKAGGLMARALEKIIGTENIAAGIVNSKGNIPDTEKIRVIEAGHPLPDERGIEGVKAMLALKQRYDIGENDVVIVLISGGGSALMPCPAEGISLEDKQKITDLLISCGADIGEINTVRKHLSRVKGGKLGAYFHPVTVISLIISDVIGNDLSVIASGPTVPDESTFSDALGILERYGLTEQAPGNVIALLEKGYRGEVAETYRELDNCRNYIIGDNRLALEAMEEKAIDTGLSPLIVTAEQKGDATEAAKSRAGGIIEGRYRGFDVLLIGGETTVRLPANAGTGGRNQHYAAVSMTAMSGFFGEWVVASVGTDGTDFMPDVAGAIVDVNSLEAARRKNIDIQSYLDRYDSHTLLEKIGDSLIVTGDTGTNVGDVIVYLKSREV
jgi:glycerate 2-kinase